ncbi:MAG: alpha/beta hydrolase-fold protein [Actinomycetota bacterium]
MPRGIATLAAGALLVAGAPAVVHAEPFSECAAQSSTTVVVGQVACQTMASKFLGGTTAFSYYVPPACAPSSRRSVCPTLYLLHGFGGGYTSMLGTAANPSAWVKALTSGPAEDPSASSQPWTMSDPAGWVSKPSIDFILVAPHGETLDGGLGPVGGLDGFWTDWNPRFAAGGDSQRYDTPPPRFESFFTRELLPFVEQRLPAGKGRAWRAIAGTSLGGFGSYKLGLQHPDLWSTMGSVSGAHNFLFAPAPDPLPGESPVAIAPPVPLPYQHVPSVTSAIPINTLPEEARGFPVSFLVFGDPAGDQATYRGNMPRDLAMNGRAWAGDTPSLYIRGFVNDATPRRPEDFGSSYPIQQAFEGIVLPMNIEMDLSLTLAGVAHEFEIHPGLHSGAYWNPFLRQQLEAQYARVRHLGGGGTPTPLPNHFDYRSIATDFSIWGWRFQLAREPVEFLTLRDVTCDGLTLRGTGVVTVTVPAACHTKQKSVTLDLGPSFPIDEPGGASDVPAYGRTVRVELS